MGRIFKNAQKINHEFQTKNPFRRNHCTNLLLRSQTRVWLGDLERDSDTLPSGSLSRRQEAMYSFSRCMQDREFHERLPLLRAFPSLQSEKPPCMGFLS